MEIKKNKKIDTRRKSLTFLLLGLNIPLLGVILLFNHKSDKEYAEIVASPDIPTYDYSPPTYIYNMTPQNKETNPTTPPKSEPIIEDLVDIETTTDIKNPVPKIETNSDTSDNNPTSPDYDVDQNPVKQTTTILPAPTPPSKNEFIDEPVHTVKTIHYFPIYPGCQKHEGNNEKLFECMSEKMSKDLFNYINIPNDIDTENQIIKINCDFIIDKKGNITSITTRSNTKNKNFESSAIDGLEKLNNKLNKRNNSISPGKNALNKPVKMKYTIPVRFSPSN